MKHMKRIVSIVLALTMVLAMGITAFAADPAKTYKLTLDNTGAETNHDFEIYQIFTGTLDEATKTLSDIKWGTGVSSAYKTTKGDAATVAETLTSANAAAFAKDVVDNGLGSVYKTVSADKGAKVEVTGLEPGYYLVRDVANSQDGLEYGSYSAYILQIVGDAEQVTKTDAPEIEKKTADDFTDEEIAQIVDGTYQGEVKWQDSSDYDIGDKVPYQITATLGSKIGEYKTYNIKITDTLSSGLTYNNDAKIMIGSRDVTSGFDISTSGNVITITPKNNDVKAAPISAAAGDKIVVKYSATLNSSAVIGVAGNPNTVKLNYSNNPNDEGNGTPGETPEDKVTVFTFKLVVDKVKEDGDPLNGAGFTLYKKVNGEYVAIGDEIKGSTQFTWNGLDAGEYKLEETTVPATYNKMEDIEFTIVAVHDEKKDDPKCTELKIVGSDKVQALLNGGEVTLTKEDATHTAVSGEVYGEIVNKQGSKLPETGGIGTTIFYVVGAMLAIGAAVVLVTKKRVNG